MRTTMKTWNIEIEKIRAMANANGRIRVQVDGRVEPAAAGTDAAPATTLHFNEETARVLLLLLKAQLAEFDAKKAKSRR